MKKIVIMLFCLAFLAQIAYATEPSDITINFDKEKKELEVIVIHPVTTPHKHYIAKIIIKKKNKVLVEEEYNNQEGNDAQTKVYSIPKLRTGDVITVEAYCNRIGSLSKTIKIE